MAPKASGKHCFTLLTAQDQMAKEQTQMLWDSNEYETENRQWFKRQDKLRFTTQRWLKWSFLENLGHAQAMDALRGPVSIGVKGHCSERLTWRDNKKCAYFILHGTSLRIASHVVWDASEKELYFLCSLEIVLYLRRLVLQQGTGGICPSVVWIIARLQSIRCSKIIVTVITVAI